VRFIDCLIDDDEYTEARTDVMRSSHQRIRWRLSRNRSGLWEMNYEGCDWPYKHILIGADILRKQPHDEHQNGGAAHLNELPFSI
jgi:hypothetical protein